MQLGPRDPAQPLLTLLDGPARVELSGATTANWVAKTANLLVDGHGSPERVGLLLPLHWQAVCFLLGAAATGATVVVAREPAELAGCSVAFTRAEVAQEALGVGVDDVFAVSGHPMGAPVRDLPVMVLDAAREIPSYGDRFTGLDAGAARVEVDGLPVESPDLRLSPSDRVLVSGDLVAALPVLLAALSAGAALVLVPDPATVDVSAVAATEQVTATAGLDLPDLPRLDLLAS